jgi:hypothetical protein
MTPLPEQSSVLGRAYNRAQNDAGQPASQADLVQLVRQIADVESVVRGEDGTKHVVVAGAHYAGFRIAIAIRTDGAVGWTLV